MISYVTRRRLSWSLLAQNDHVSSDYYTFVLSLSSAHRKMQNERYLRQA